MLIFTSFGNNHGIVCKVRIFMKLRILFLSNWVFVLVKDIAVRQMQSFTKSKLLQIFPNLYACNWHLGTYHFTDRTEEGLKY